MNRVAGILTLIAILVAAPVVNAADVLDGSDVTSLVFLDKSDYTDAAGEIDEADWNAATPIATSLNAFDLSRKLTFNIQADEETGAVATASASAGGEKKNPGRALILSAIIPGAGEMYAGSKLKAALFFAIEVGCWYGAISYAQQGQDKEEEYETFAEAHYKESYYRQVEFTAATYANAGDQDKAYTGTLSEWRDLVWEEKLRYLPANFTHELSTEHNQQYYENVGKYLTQFGWGWNDWINGRTTDQINDVASGPAQFNWKNAPGTSALVYEYIDMRAESNDLLDASANFFSVIMINHVVSALDAGFTVRRQNRNIAEVETGVRGILYNEKPVATAGISVRF
jgi:hypothetical protein